MAMQRMFFIDGKMEKAEDCDKHMQGLTGFAWYSDAEAAIEQARKDGAREAEGRIIRLLEEMRTGLDDCNHLGMAIDRIRSRAAEGKPSRKIAKIPIPASHQEANAYCKLLDDMNLTINQIANYINARIDREGGER